MLERNVITTGCVRRPDAAKLLGISVSALRKRERLNDAPPRARIGRCIVFPVAGIHDYIQQRLSA